MCEQRLSQALGISVESLSSVAGAKQLEAERSSIQLYCVYLFVCLCTSPTDASHSTLQHGQSNACRDKLSQTKGEAKQPYASLHPQDLPTMSAQMHR